MFGIQYKHYLINNSYSFTGKTMYYHVWKLTDEGEMIDLWGDKFRSVRQAKNFIDNEGESNEKI
jgi:hypothetical protein